jgi:hypothetical protein
VDIDPGDRPVVVLVIMAVDFAASITAGAYLRRAVLPVRVAFLAGRTAERVRAGNGCFPAASPAGRSAPSSSLSACASSACVPSGRRSAALFQLATDLPAAVLAACSASTSRSPSPGNAPPPVTGQPTPPIRPA